MIMTAGGMCRRFSAMRMRVKVRQFPFVFVSVEMYPIAPQSINQAASQQHQHDPNHQFEQARNGIRDGAGQ